MRTRCTSPRRSTHGSDAKTSATTVGIVDWKTIAPVMLPMASVSLPWRTQMIELNFSGSSVAIGAMTSASRTWLTPRRRRDVLDGVDEEDRSDDDEPERREHLDRRRSRRRGHVGSRRARRDCRAGGSAAAPGPRRASAASAWRWPLTYQRVQADQDRRATSQRPATGRPAGRRPRSRGHSRWRSSAGRGPARRCRRPATRRVARRRRKVRTPMPVTNMASVASMNGAPRIAPTPTSCEPAPVANTMAMIGMSVSGSAVPTAASTEPTAPSPGRACARTTRCRW